MIGIYEQLFKVPRMKRNLLFAFSLLSALFALSACAAGYPPAYSAEAIEARVIDAETKQPLEGVVITADWELRGGGLALGGSSNVGELMVMEAVTDRNGKFYFPAWGPIRQSKGELHNRDPRLILFKPGYRYEILSNKPRYEDEAALEPVRRSDWNGKAIEMKPFKGTIEQYARHLDFMTTSLESILSEECGWKKIPRMILEINGQSEIFRKHGRFELPSVDSLEVRYSNLRSRCGSVKEYFRNYQP